MRIRERVHGLIPGLELFAFGPNEIRTGPVFAGNSRRENRLRPRREVFTLAASPISATLATPAFSPFPLCFSVPFCPTVFGSPSSWQPLGLAFSFYLIRTDRRPRRRGMAGCARWPPRSKRERKAYLNRQVATIGVDCRGDLFSRRRISRGCRPRWDFVMGAVCSLAAGFIGMRIAVLGQRPHGTTRPSESRHAALKMAFNGGAVTGLLVVGLALLSVGIFLPARGPLFRHATLRRSTA